MLHWRLRFLFCGLHRSGCFAALEDVPNLLRNVHRDGAGVRLLFGHTQARQKIDDRLRLDLELASQFVNSDLRCVSHASLRVLLFLLTFEIFLVRFVSRCGMFLRGRILI
jgi:hypothetical protein